MALQNVEANITLDLYNHDTTPSTVKAIQLDSQTRYVAAMLQSMGAEYGLDSGATVQLIVIRPDKVGVQITGETFTYGDEGAQFLGPYAELTQVALAVNGKMRGQFKITSGDQILRTEIFAISNGEALDASTDEWADEYDGYNLEEMATSIETNTADIASLEADVSQIKEELSEYEGIFTADVDESVQNWLDDHPEATTTVQDGSLTEAKLSDALKLKTIKDHVTPEMYGAKGDGISDDTTALQSAINSGKPIFVPDGTYIVTQPLICRTVCMMELSKNATIKAKTGTTLSCLLGLRNDGNAYSLAENEYICGGIFDGNGCCDAVIGINYTRGKIENCIIQGVKHYGIHIGHNLQSEGVGSGSLRVIDVIVQNTNASLGTIGIYSNRTDNYIRAITKNMETGFSVLSGETLDGCHAWIAYASMFTNSVAYILRGTQDILTACTSDTMRYGIKIQSGSGRINVSDFSYYHNTNVATPTVLEDTPCVVFDFYSRTHIFLATNILVNLAGSQGKIISDSAIGSDLIRFVNLGISQGENAVTANIPKDVSALNPAKIPLSETSGTNLTQAMIDAIDTNNIIGGYSAISGLEGWSIVITTVNDDVRVQTIIRAGHGAVVRRYSNGTWNSFS